MRTLITRRRAVIGVAAAAVFALAGTALAYWTDSGSGGGTASVGSSTPWTVTVTPAAGNAALTPAGPTDSYTFTVANAGTGNQQASTAAVTVANPNGSTWTAVAGCSSADYTISGVTFTPATVAPQASITGSFTVQMKDTGVNQNGCKGATVPLYVAIN